MLSGNGTASTLAKADLDFKQAKAKLKVKFVGVSGASAGNLAAAGGKFKQTADSRSGVCACVFVHVCALPSQDGF